MTSTSGGGGGGSGALDEVEAHVAQLAAAIRTGQTEMWDAINALEEQVGRRTDNETDRQTPTRVRPAFH